LPRLRALHRPAAIAYPAEAASNVGGLAVGAWVGGLAGGAAAAGATALGIAGAPVIGVAAGVAVGGIVAIGVGDFGHMATSVWHGVTSIF
jgi:hypothetical protein